MGSPEPLVGGEGRRGELSRLGTRLGRAPGLTFATQLCELRRELLLFGFGARQVTLETLDLGVFVFEGAPEGVAVGAQRLDPPAGHGGRIVGGLERAAARGALGRSTQRADEALAAVVVDYALRPLAGQQRASAATADGVVMIVLRASKKAS